MNKLKEKVEALLLPAWSLEEIQKYLDCSRSYAVQIKNATEKKYGAIEVDKGKGKTNVSSDAVIKMMGGKDRLTEMQIITSAFMLGVKNNDN